MGGYCNLLVGSYRIKMGSDGSIVYVLLDARSSRKVIAVSLPAVYRVVQYGVT